MATDNGSQSIGRAGKLDGISGSDHPGTEGATSGAGISQGVAATEHNGQPGAGRQEDKPGGSPGQPANPTHGVGKNGVPSAD